MRQCEWQAATFKEGSELITRPANPVDTEHSLGNLFVRAVCSFHNSRGQGTVESPRANNTFPFLTLHTTNIESKKIGMKFNGCFEGGGGVIRSRRILRCIVSWSLVFGDVLFGTFRWSFKKLLQILFFFFKVIFIFLFVRERSKNNVQRIIFIICNLTLNNCCWLKIWRTIISRKFLEKSIIEISLTKWFFFFEILILFSFFSSSRINLREKFEKNLKMFQPKWNAKSNPHEFQTRCRVYWPTWEPRDHFPADRQE